MTENTLSRTGVPIRLTDERWAHIVDEHCELAGLRGEVLETISDAEYVVAGRYNELLARMLDSRRALVVVYRETSATDGFVITAFVTTRTSNLRRREQIWPPKT